MICFAADYIWLLIALPPAYIFWHHLNLKDPFFSEQENRAKQTQLPQIPALSVCLSERKLYC
ncbi:DUF788 domain-containing protein [Lentibacillus sp. CBA3610]|nr:DUF788 domain-containing protein [Lentibacillus sp. CBA3610]